MPGYFLLDNLCNIAQVEAHAYTFYINLYLHIFYLQVFQKLYLWGKF